MNFDVGFLLLIFLELCFRRLNLLPEPLSSLGVSGEARNVGLEIFDLFGVKLRI